MWVPIYYMCKLRCGTWRCQRCLQQGVHEATLMGDIHQHGKAEGLRCCSARAGGSQPGCSPRGQSHSRNLREEWEGAKRTKTRFSLHEGIMLNFSHCSPPVQAAVISIYIIGGNTVLAEYVMWGTDGENWILAFSFWHLFWGGIKAHPKNRKGRSMLKKCEL